MKNLNKEGYVISVEIAESKPRELIEIGKKPKLANTFPITLVEHQDGWEILRGLRQVDWRFSSIIGAFFEIGWRIGLGAYVFTSHDEIAVAESGREEGVVLYWKRGEKIRAECVLDGKSLIILEDDMEPLAHFCVDGYPEDLWDVLQALDYFNYDNGINEYPISNLLEAVMEQGITYGKKEKADHK